jgi:hypothetical protein
MSVEGRRGGRALISGRALVSGRVFCAGVLQLLIVKFSYGDLGAVPLLFCWKPNVQKIGIEPL